MIYAQVKGGQKLHLAYQAGEGQDDLHLMKAGYISNPICGRLVPDGYRMTINVPLANACKRCLRVYAARHKANKKPQPFLTGEKPGWSWQGD